MGWKPTNATVCPWCRSPIRAQDNTARHYGTLFHAICVEQLEQANAEVAEVREATK